MKEISKLKIEEKKEIVLEEVESKRELMKKVLATRYNARDVKDKILEKNKKETA